MRSHPHAYIEHMFEDGQAASLIDEVGVDYRDGWAHGLQLRQKLGTDGGEARMSCKATAAEDDFFAKGCQDAYRGGARTRTGLKSRRGEAEVFFS